MFESLPLGFLENTVVFILSLGFLIAFHELGHFLVAKWCDVRVLTFSVGMGKKIFVRKWGETEYALSAIPFGGYVQMDGESPEDEGSGDGRDFPSKSLPARTAIVLAGPVFNLILAFFIYVGINATIGIVTPPDVAVSSVNEGSPAESAGLLTGDIIVTVDGRAVTTPSDVGMAVRRTSEGEAVILDLLRDGTPVTVAVTPAYNETHGTRLIGIGTEPLYPSVVGPVKKGGPAEAVGLREGDRLTRIGGSEVATWREVIVVVSGLSDPEIPIVWDRDGAPMTGTLTAEINAMAPAGPDGQKPFDLGIAPHMNRTQVGFVGAVQAGVQDTWVASWILLDGIREIFRSSQAREGVAGPVGIAQYISDSYAYGFAVLLELLALISVNLAIVNLLPFPVLDGGQLVFLGIEALTRRPLSERVMIMVNQVGIAVLILLFVVLTWNDIGRMFLGGSG